MTFVRIAQVDRKENDKEKDKSNKSEAKEKEPKERLKFGKCSAGRQR